MFQQVSPDADTTAPGIGFFPVALCSLGNYQPVVVKQLEIRRQRVRLKVMVYGRIAGRFNTGFFHER